MEKIFFDPTALLIGSLSLVILLEGLISRRKAQAARRWTSNFALGAINLFAEPILLSTVVATYSQAGLEDWGGGLLSRLGAGLGMSLFLTLISLEFVGYWWHRLSHAVPVLWRIHSVHHNDNELDATTSLRHHPLEPALGSFINLPVIFILGPDPMVAAIAATITTVIDVINHGNLSLGRFERPLSLLVVTPGFHCVHHSSERRFTDSNFSNNFPIFDYLFRSARCWSSEELRTHRLGLDEYRTDKDQRLDRLLIQPFLRR